MTRYGPVQRKPEQRARLTTHRLREAQRPPLEARDPNDREVAPRIERDDAAVEPSAVAAIDERRLDARHDVRIRRHEPAADDPARPSTPSPQANPRRRTIELAAARTSGSSAIAASGSATSIAGPAIALKGPIRPTASRTLSGGTASVSVDTTVDFCARRRSSVCPGT